MKRCHRIMAVGLMELVVHSPASASFNPEQLKAWLQAEVEAASRYPNLTGFEFRYIGETHYPALPGEIEAHWREVQGRPDHPKRLRLEQMERYAEEGPIRNSVIFWTRGPDQWRASGDQTGSAAKYNDFLLMPDRSWILTAEQLTLMDPRLAVPPERDISGLASTMEVQVGDFLHGSATYARPPGVVDHSTLVIQGARWKVTVRRFNAPYAEMEGVWDEGLSRGFANSGRLLSQPPNLLPVPQCAEKRYSDWSVNPVLKRWVAHRVEWFEHDGRLMSVKLFDDAELITDARWEEVTRTPDPGTPDAMRGALTYTSVWDYREGREVFTEFGPEGPVSTVMPPRADPAARASSQRRMQHIGWGSATFLILTLIAIRIWRSSVAR